MVHLPTSKAMLADRTPMLTVISTLTQGIVDGLMILFGGIRAGQLLHELETILPLNLSVLSDDLLFRSKAGDTLLDECIVLCIG
jgi:hypothetical protein